MMIDFRAGRDDLDMDHHHVEAMGSFVDCCRQLPLFFTFL